MRERQRHRPLTRQKYALEIILETHEAWKRLIAGQPPQPSDIAMCVGSPSRISSPVLLRLAAMRCASFWG